MCTCFEISLTNSLIHVHVKVTFLWKRRDLDGLGALIQK